VIEPVPLRLFPSRPSIALLSLSACPAAVLCAVGAVVIDAIQRVTDRTSTHIFQELRVVAAPFVGHRNPASAPFRVTLRLFVVAAVLGAGPRAVFARDVVADSRAVRGDAGNVTLGSQASAASRALAVTQVAALNDGHAAAVASANPADVDTRSASSVWFSTLNDKSPESLSGEVSNAPSHGEILPNGVTVSKNFTLSAIEFSNRALMREIGLLVRERVVRRTRSGIAATGARFAPYSAGYALQKAKALRGSGTVNLTVSGDMLNKLVLSEVTETSVTVGY
jgi:hypothetical protein